MTKNLAVPSESSNGEGLFDFSRKEKGVKKKERKKRNSRKTPYFRVRLKRNRTDPVLR